MQFDTNDLLYVYLDRRRRRRKFLATTFLRALGYPTDEDIVSQFYNIENLKLSEKMDEERTRSQGALRGHPRRRAHRGARPTSRSPSASCASSSPSATRRSRSSTAREDEILLKSLRKDPAKDEEAALKDIYRNLRPGDPPTAANARALLKRLFFDPKKYDLTRVGRYKINQKLGIEVDSDRADHGARGFPRCRQVPPQA